MIKTPLGNLIAIENKTGEFPGIDILCQDSEDNIVELVARIEYNPYRDAIATYSYSKNEEDFIKRCTYKKGDSHVVNI